MPGITNVRNTFEVSKRARQTIERTYRDSDIPHLAVEVMRNRVEKPVAKPKNLFQRILNFFNVKESLNVGLGNDQNGDFFILATRKINRFKFIGKKVPVDLNNVCKDIKVFDSALEKSEQEIANQLSLYK